MPGATVAVGGLTASIVDFNALMGAAFRLAFVLLLVSFRSLAPPKQPVTVA
jgi:hypothetical protein